MRSASIWVALLLIAWTRSCGAGPVLRNHKEQELFDKGAKSDVPSVGHYAVASSNASMLQANAIAGASVQSGWGWGPGAGRRAAAVGAGEHAVAAVGAVAAVAWA